jgi:asparagine synthase (glutamine-hydrolysing)
MCGVAGFIDFSRQSKSESLLGSLKRMTDSIVHRGPDDEGLWTDERFGLALGFRRLAILDLSPLGKQPMTSADGRFIIIFNGEIYNFLELRKKLERLGHNFKGHSDTEVILAAFVEWGIEPAIKQLNGMFAIAVWDNELRELTLIRDRIGKKPLYYSSKGNTFLFGSELKSFRAHPDFAVSIDRDSLALYLKFGYVPSPHSIYENVFKLAPGKMVKISTETGEIGSQTTYWSIEEAARKGVKDPLAGSIPRS